MNRRDIGTHQPRWSTWGDVESLRQQIEAGIREVLRGLGSGESDIGVEDLVEIIEAVRQLEGLPGTSAIISSLGLAALSASLPSHIADAVMEAQLHQAMLTLGRCAQAWEDFLS